VGERSALSAVEEVNLEELDDVLRHIDFSAEEGKIKL